MQFHPSLIWPAMVWMLSYGAQDVTVTFKQHHVLWVCLKLRDIWLSSPLGTVWDLFQDLNFFNAVFSIAKSHREVMFRVLGMISWCMWQDRNKWVFKKCCNSPEKI